MDDYLRLNRANWDERAPIHAGAVSYNVARFIDDPGYISKGLRFEQPLLGDVTGLDTVHLQCHIGTDSVSLARLRARVTGLDLSPASLAQARTLAARTGTPIRFVESDVYSALDVLEPASFDLVYTSIGVLCWLPSVSRWADVVSGLLKPGGRLFIRDGHPMLFTIDDGKPDLPVVRYPYFEQAQPLVVDDAGTYVATTTAISASITHQWSHGIGEIVTALLDAGMEITALAEHDSVPWEALPGQMTRDDTTGEWRLTDRPWRLAASFTLQARKR